MNRTGHGRIGRYKVIKGVTHKLCNGPLHPEGKWVALSEYFFFKTGKRTGKPFTQCIKCERARKNADGMIELDRVRFIFEELQRRIGRAEVIRRLHVSRNFWLRYDHKTYKTINIRTARKALVILRELRADDVALHKDSIRHGAIARGREPRRAIHRRDFYIREFDDEREYDRRRQRNGGQSA